MSEVGSDPTRATSVTAGAGQEPLYALREAREAAGLHIAALAAALKVPVRKLEALEAGRYGELPDLTFARALASSACRHLRVDSKPILEQIPMRRDTALGTPPHAISAPFKSPAPGGAVSAPSWLGRPSVIVAGALVLGAVALLLLPPWERLPTIGSVVLQAPGQSVESLSSEPSLPVLSPGANQAQSEGIPAEQDSEPVAAVDSEGLVEVAPAQRTDAVAGDTAASSVLEPPAPPGGPSTAAASTDGSGAVLYIEATGESWLEVTNGAGAVVAQRLLKPGDTLEFSSAPPYRVVLGRAEAAKVLVRGQAFDIMPYARNSVARFEAR